MILCTFFNKACLTNYADDNTLSTSHKSISVVQNVLQSEASTAIDWFTENKMLANPDKFQAIVLGNKSDEIKLKINGLNIVPQKSVTLMGVILDSQLNYNLHITEICKRAGRQLNVLKRVSSYLSIKARMAILKTFIISHFNFCPVVWHHCGKVNTIKMEKIQERALRYVFSDYKSSYDELLARGNLQTLEVGRLRYIAIQVFKIVNKISPHIYKIMHR